MKTRLVQLQNITAEDFKNEILNGVQNQLSAFQKSIETKKPSTYIDRKEAGRLLKVSTVTIDDWARKKILKRYSIGNRVLFRRSEIEQTLENSTTQ